MKKGAVTFLLPGNNRSGGVRVTALMGNLLLERGYQVRIVHPETRFFTLANFAALASGVKHSLTGTHATGWLETFVGPTQQYVDINHLEFQRGEIVIAVGTYMVPYLYELRSQHVIKVRYNHGLPTQMTEDFRTAWSLPMLTITVSSTLVSELERLSGEKVRIVVPNGIDTSQYYPTPAVKRDSIGAIFSLHPNKAPQDVIRLFRRVGEVFPKVPRLVFSTERRPRGLVDCRYERYPPIERVRELYSKSLVWLLASHTEGLPGPVLEAMACGAVVISTDNDGSLELIKDGINGMVVPKGDIEGFLRRIRVVLSDDCLRELLVQGGFDTVRKFTWAAAGDRMEKFLDSVVHSTK